MERISTITIRIFLFSLLTIITISCGNQDKTTQDGPEDQKVLVENERKSCQGNCDDVQKADTIPGQLIMTFGFDITDLERIDIIKRLRDELKATVYECMCESNDIILIERPNLGMEETLSEAREELEEEEKDKVQVYKNIPVNIDENTPPIAYNKPNIRKYSTSITLAVIDGGVDVMDGELNNKVWTNTGELGGRDGLDDDDNCLADDLHGWNFTESTSQISKHGTFVSSIAVSGIEDKKVGIMDLNIFASTERSSTLFHALCAMDYASENGAQVVNLSWGYYSQAKEADDLRDYDVLLLNFLRTKLSGAIVTASAGNDSVNTDYCLHFPSGFSSSEYSNTDHIISVTSTNPGNPQRLAGYANCGRNTVTIAANGEFEEDGVIHKGTSYAAPVIANAAIQYLLDHPGSICNSNFRAIDCILNSINSTGSLEVETQGAFDKDEMGNCTCP